MYIEPKTSGNFLVKREFPQKFFVKIGNEGITKEVLMSLTKKECSYISETQQYGVFEKLVYNQIFLKEVLLQSKFLIHMIEIVDIVDKKNPLYQQGLTLKGWLETSFPVEFIYNSNNIEGSKIPRKEIEKIMQNKKLAYKVKNEVIEVQNSIKSWHFLQKNFIWNEANIKKLYHMLTKNLLQETGIPYPRGFKKTGIVVNNESTVNPENVHTSLGDLLYQYKSKRKLTFPLQLAFDFHLRYEQIHPFENGNGRTGRLLMNKILIQNGMLPMIVFKDNKEAYFSAIKKASQGSNIGIKSYYTFMLEQYKKSMETLYDLKIF